MARALPNGSSRSPPGRPSRGAPSNNVFDSSLTPDDRHRFTASLVEEAPALAEEYGQIIEHHDFAGTYAGLAGEMGLLPDHLCTSIAAMAVVLWTAVHRASDPSDESVRALAAQVDLVLQARRPDYPPEAGQAAHSALICHFVVLYHALQAARAGDEAARRQFALQAADIAHRMFGNDLQTVKLVAGGFLPAR